MKILRHLAAGMVTLLLVLLFGVAAAQPRGSGEWASRASPPRIDGFDVEQVAQLAQGSQLLFSLFGTPGASASVHIEGAARDLPLVEHEAGVYEGNYTVDEADHIAPDSRVVGDLRAHGELASAVLEEPLVLASAAVPALPPVAVAQASDDALPVSPPARCANCGVVESIGVTRVPGDTGWLGAVAGGLLGALLGDQVSGEHHRTAGRVLGAVGGAYAGHAIERSSRMRDRYEVVVRLDNSARRTITLEQPPALRVGDKVSVEQGRLRRLP